MSLPEFMIEEFDNALRSVFGKPNHTGRSTPGEEAHEAELPEEKKAHTARLMRINHTGEICAQALYHGQAAVARNADTRDKLKQAANEEGDHLVWCEKRIDELGGRTSVLNPLWYGGSYAIGVAAAIAGDRWSLGFVSETEKQVEDHLEEHLAQVDPEDQRTRAILLQMRDDEIRHGADARANGGKALPLPIRLAMKAASKVMTKATYRL